MFTFVRILICSLIILFILFRIPNNSGLQSFGNSTFVQKLGSPKNIRKSLDQLIILLIILFFLLNIITYLKN